MKKTIKKTMAVIGLVGALVVVATPVVAMADSVNVGGGTWNYGTRVVGINKKEVYSDYLHPYREHKSSCSIGAKFKESGWVAPKATAKSKCTGEWNDRTHTYYDYR